MANETHGSLTICWGNCIEEWGGLPDFVSDEALIGLTIRAQYEEGLDLRVWTGGGVLLINGLIYSGVGPDIIQVEVGAANTDGSGQVNVVLADVANEQRDLWYEDPGNVVVTMGMVYSENGGENWIQLPRSNTGFLSAPRVVNSSYTFDVATTTEDVDRGFLSTWNDVEASQRGDRAFEHLLRISEGRPLNWPPISL